MNSRSQDDLDHLPSLSLSADDRSGRTPDRNQKSPGKTTAPKKTESRSSGFPMATIVLSIALLALAGGGYLQIQELHKELQDARTQLKATTTVLSDISGAVSQTGESLSKSDSKVQDELKAVNFEIRKLWDLSNKRNRPNIEAQEKQIDSLSARVAESGKALESSIGKIDKNAKELANAEKGLTALRKEVRAVNADVVAGAAVSREQMDNLQKTVDSLSASVKKAASNSQHLGSGIRNQVKEYGEKIKAIDAHRQQVNRRLLQLENSIRSLQSGAQAGLIVKPAATVGSG